MSYPGGKGGSGVVQQIINQIPPHRVFISPFFGHCRVTMTMRPSALTIGVDVDWPLVQYWESLGFGMVQQGDALEFLAAYPFVGDEFVYCDPPYLFDVRSSKDAIYRCEFGEVDQHTKLLNLLKVLPCKVAISGYASSLYESLLTGWRSINYSTVTRSGRRVQESLWMNYPEPVQLHDYRFLGNNFRERERVKKIKKNFLGKFQRLTALERYALLSALDELGIV